MGHGQLLDGSWVMGHKMWPIVSSAQSSGVANEVIKPDGR